MAASSNVPPGEPVKQEPNPVHEGEESPVRNLKNVLTESKPDRVFLIFEGPSEYNYSLSSHDWSKLKFSEKRLKPGWTNLFAKKMYDKIPFSLRFCYHRINKLHSRQRNMTYFVAKAQCKFGKCGNYMFSINANSHS